ncbi:hypothetical protein ACPPVO_30570 [Dactylosporangium sp. McL0621]
MPRALIVGNTDGIGLALTRRLLDEGWTAVGGVTFTRWRTRLSSSTT